MEQYFKPGLVLYQMKVMVHVPGFVPEGPGIPSGMVISMRSYYNDEYGAYDYCYNFGTKEDVPSSCDPDKGKYMSFGIQKLVDE